MPPSINMFPPWASGVSPSHFLLFFLPLDRSCVQLQLQCTLSSHPNLSAPSSPLYSCSLFLSGSLVVKTLTFFTLLCFSFSSVLKMTLASSCVLLYMFPALTNPLSHSTIKSKLKCSVPISEPLLRVWHSLWLICVSCEGGIRAL